MLKETQIFKNKRLDYGDYYSVYHFDNHITKYKKFKDTYMYCKKCTRQTLY